MRDREYKILLDKCNLAEHSPEYAYSENQIIELYREKSSQLYNQESSDLDKKKIVKGLTKGCIEYSASKIATKFIHKLLKISNPALMILSLLGVTCWNERKRVKKDKEKDLVKKIESDLAQRYQKDLMKQGVKAEYEDVSILKESLRQAINQRISDIIEKELIAKESLFGKDSPSNSRDRMLKHLHLYSDTKEFQRFENILMKYYKENYPEEYKNLKAGYEGKGLHYKEMSKDVASEAIETATFALAEKVMIKAFAMSNPVIFLVELITVALYACSCELKSQKKEHKNNEANKEKGFALDNHDFDNLSKDSLKLLRDEFPELKDLLVRDEVKKSIIPEINKVLESADLAKFTKIRKNKDSEDHGI
jgi:hypothetical protein